MAPVDCVVIRAAGIELVENVVGSAVLDEAVWIVEPARWRGEMVARPVGVVGKSRTDVAPARRGSWSVGK